MNKQIPPIPVELVEWLERVHPSRCPDLKMSNREIWIEVGKQQLIRVLRAKYEEQNRKDSLIDNV